MSTPLVDKSFEGRIRRMQADIAALTRRLRTALPDPVPDMPDSWWGYGPASSTVTAAASTWEETTPALAVTLTPIADLEVEVNMSANIVGNVTVYGMIGVRAVGGVNLEPDYDQLTGLQQFAPSPFSAAAANVQVYGSKILRLPVGVATTLSLCRRRNATSYAPSVNYSMMQVIPRRWL